MVHRCGLCRRDRHALRILFGAGQRGPLHTGARTAWHSHPNGQTLYFTDGIGLVQRRGAPLKAIHPGDRVVLQPGEDHWHGAAPTRFMTHLSVVEVDETSDIATWGAQVGDDEYRPAASSDQEVQR